MMKLFKKLFTGGHSLESIVASPEDVIFPPTKHEIGYEEFKGNNQIKSITIPGTVKRINSRAFAECENLETVNLCEGIEAIEPNVFTGCEKLRHIVYPNSIKEYHGSTFHGTSLDTPVMNASGTILVYCPPTVSGQEWTVPDTVKVIANQAFMKNSDLEILHFPKDLKIIESFAFSNCGIREITIPSSVEEIHKASFYRCQHLESVNILNPYAKVALGAFEGCIHLNNLKYADITESDTLFHLKGEHFLISHLEDNANLDHHLDPEFRRLVEKCALGNPEAKEELAEFFEEWSDKPSASPFYIRASNYWRYRAYICGNPRAKDWFTKFFFKHPGEHLESILPDIGCYDSYPNFYSFNIPGNILNDLGYAFFDANKKYEIKQLENTDGFVVGTFESYDGPDEDGFGSETYYDWWFLDSNMQLIPGVKRVNASFREMNYLDDYNTTKSRAISYLTNGNNQNS